MIGTGVSEILIDEDLLPSKFTTDRLFDTIS